MLEGLNIRHIYIGILLFAYVIILIVFHFKIKKDPELKAFFLDSLRENGKPSGKSLTGLYFVQIIGFATIVSIIYAPQHLIPEYILISILAFVGGLYGMKVASKYVNTGVDSVSQQSTTTTTTTNEQQTNIVKQEDNKDNKDKKNNEPNPEDIG
jgi:hypothetical protein